MDGEWGHAKGPTRKIKAMFAYLVYKGRRGARKETLIDLLWPEQQDLARAADSFHQALHCLRKALEPDLAPGGMSSYIAYGEGYYRFNALKPVWSDVEAFEACCRKAQRASVAGDNEEALVYWALALDLYRGDYLADIAVEYTENRDYEWCLPRRVLLRRLHEVALLELTSSCARLGLPAPRPATSGQPRKGGVVSC